MTTQEWKLPQKKSRQNPTFSNQDTAHAQAADQHLCFA
jgi:hypothetical protein